MDKTTAVPCQRCIYIYIELGLFYKTINKSGTRPNMDDYELTELSNCRESILNATTSLDPAVLNAHM